MSGIIQPSIKRIVVTNTFEQNLPDFEFRNPLDADLELNGISVIPNAAFKNKGKAKITINDIPLNPIIGTDLVDVSKIQIIEGNSIKELKRQHFVRFFLWNIVDDSEIALTVGITLGNIKQ